MLASSKKPTFIVISETSLLPTQSTPRLTGYRNSIRADRSNNDQRQGGGLLVYIRDSFYHRHIRSYTSEAVPDIKDTRTGTIEIHMDTDFGTLGLYAAYRPNAAKISIDSITQLLDNMTSANEDAALLVGDINCACRAQNYSDVRRDGHDFDKYLADNGPSLKVVKLPKHTHFNAGARSWTSPDIVVATRKEGFQPTSTIGGMYGSDHRAVWTTFRLARSKAKRRDKPAPLKARWNFQRMDTDKYCQSLSHRANNALNRLPKDAKSSTILKSVEDVIFGALKTSTPRGRYREDTEPAQEERATQEWETKEREIVTEIDQLVEANQANPDTNNDQFAERLNALQAKLLSHNESHESDNTFIEDLITTEPWRAMRLLATPNTTSARSKADLNRECKKFQEISSHKDTAQFEAERRSLLAKLKKFWKKLNKNPELMAAMSISEIRKSLCSTKPRKAEGVTTYSRKRCAKRRHRNRSWSF